MKICSKCNKPEGETVFSPNRKGSVCRLCRSTKDTARHRAQSRLASQKHLNSPHTFSDPFGWWVTGLVDGEGSFISACYVGEEFVKDRKGVRRSTNSAGFMAHFTLALRSDDVATLGKLKDYFGCGRLNEKPARGSSKPQKKFVIQRIEDLVHVVIPHFRKFPLQSKKALDFEIWSDIVLFVYENLHGAKRWLRDFPQEVGHIQTMCSELQSVRVYREGVVLQ